MRQMKIRKGPSLTILILLLLSLFNQGISTDQAVIEKQKGVNFTAWDSEGLLSLDSAEAMKNIRATGANWISLVVTQYQENIRAKAIAPSRSTPTDESLAYSVKEAHSQGFKVMLKPHVDLSDDPGHWRAQIGSGFSLQDWQEWFDSYRKMILHYARFAEEHQVDQFSVGTELELSTPHSGQWRRIVSDIRQVYSGPLTYSANHSGEELFLSWWDALDYVGIDAYYPLAVRSNPTLAEMELAWQQFILGFRGLYNTWHKPILFTELGYRSADGAAQAPYAWGGPSQLDLREQALAYQAFFNQVFWQPWFGGVFFWNWEPKPFTTGQCDVDYTPFGKPAEDVLRAGFGGLPRLILPEPSPDDERAYPVFQNGLREGWRDSSWAKTELNGVGPAAGAAVSTAFSSGQFLRVSAAAGDAFAVSVDGEPFDSSPYQWLELLVHPESPGQQWTVQLVDSETRSARSIPVNNCRYVPGGAMAAGAWNRILIPLESLLGDEKKITSILFSSWGATPVDLWIESVQLLPAN